MGLTDNCNGVAVFKSVVSAVKRFIVILKSFLKESSGCLVGTINSARNGIMIKASGRKLQQ